MNTFRKSLPFELKSGSTGEFRAVFATFNVIDHDGDVTRPGAFKTGAEVIIGSWGHKTSELPVGKGVIVADAVEAAVEGSFFLDTQPGKDTYQTVRNLGSLGEWSYVFSVQKSSFGQHDGRDVRFLEDLAVYSVDPVLAGAGIDTRTTDIKSLGFLEHGESLVRQVSEYLERVKQRSAIRGADGRSLSAANMASLGELAESLKRLSGELGQFAQPEQKSNNELAIEYLRAVQRQILAGLPA